MALFSLIANLIVTGRLSSFFLPFFVQKILKRFRKLHLASPLPHPSDLVILQSNSWWDALLFFACLPNLKLLIPDRFFHHFPWINGWIDSIQLIPPDPEASSKTEKIFQEAKNIQEKNRFVCIFFHKKKENQAVIDAYKKIFGRLHYNLVFAYAIKEKIPKRFVFFRFYQKQIKMTFSKE